MVKIIDLDERASLRKQMEEDVGPVILINTFTMNSEDADQFLKTWTSAAEISKKFPGVISVQLHRGIAGSSAFVAYLIFESIESIKQLYNNADFRSSISNYPASTTVYPHIFKKVAVPGICVDWIHQANDAVLVLTYRNIEPTLHLPLHLKYKKVDHSTFKSYHDPGMMKKVSKAGVIVSSILSITSIIGIIGIIGFIIQPTHFIAIRSLMGSLIDSLRNAYA